LERSGGSIEDFIFVRAAYEYVLGVSPKDPELTACLEALSALRAAGVSVPPGGAHAPQDSGQLDVHAQLIWVLLNHNDFITLR
jgi:sugar/nucleoside kinase (ribokinase family)